MDANVHHTRHVCSVQVKVGVLRRHIHSGTYEKHRFGFDDDEVRYLKCMTNWKEHPAVRSGQDLTFGERAADAMRAGMGSWPFVFSALLFLAIWMMYNGNHGFDKYPFILLNLVLSCLAALQGAILLIAAKRADQISSELAQNTYKLDQENLELTKQVAALTAQIEKLTVEIHKHINAG